MATILNYFFKNKQDRSASLPRVEPGALPGGSRRDISVPPTTAKLEPVKQIDYSTIQGASPTTQSGLKSDPRKYIFSSAAPSKVVQPPTLNLPTASEPPKVQMLDPESPTKVSQPVFESQAPDPLRYHAKPLEYKMEVPIENIKARLLEASDRFYPRSFPQPLPDVDFYQPSLVSNPISQQELQRAIDQSARNQGRDGQNLKTFLDIKKEIEFCKKYLKINEAKKSKVQQEISELRDKAAGGLNTTYSSLDTSMNVEGLSGESLELRLAKERIELERLRAQMAQVSGSPGVEFITKSPSRRPSQEKEVNIRDSSPTRLPSIFPDYQGISQHVDMGPMAKAQSTFVPVEPTPRIQLPKSNPLATKIQ